jgi:hypothetical protein
LCFLCDAPERCTITSIQSYSGLTTKRWSHSAYINQNKFPSCNACTTRRIAYFHNGLPGNAVSCSRCGNWDYDNTSNVMKANPTKEYPIKKHIDSPCPPFLRNVGTNYSIMPMKLTFAELRLGTYFAKFNYDNSTWTKAYAVGYFKCLGVKGSCYDQFLENKTSPVILPPIWNSRVNLDQFINTPMHQIFLGVVKSLIELTFNWLKTVMKGQQFGRTINPFLLKVKHLQCGFCKMESFGGGSKSSEYTTGGWVSESYLAYARLLPLVGFTAEVMMAGQRGYTAYRCLINSAYVMIAQLMQEVSCDSLFLDNVIKLFLTSVDKFENEVWDNVANCCWYIKPNFISLLNFPNQIKYFGSLRLYWEGNRERQIQYMKPLLKNMRNTVEYLKQKLYESHRDYTLTFLSKRSNDAFENYTRFPDFRIYKSYPTLRTEIMANYPFSGIMLENTTNNDTWLVPHCIVLSEVGLQAHKIKVLPGSSQEIENVCFVEIEAEMQPALIFSTKPLLEEAVKDCFIATMTPCEDIQGYCFVCKSWRLMGRNGKLQLPTINTVVFSDLVV